MGLVALLIPAVLEDENNFTDLFRKKVRNLNSKTSKGLTRDAVVHDVRSRACQIFAGLALMHC